MCLKKGVESDKGTSVAFFECSSYIFDRDRKFSDQSQTKASAKMDVQFFCGSFSCFISYLCQYCGEGDFLTLGFVRLDIASSSLKSDPEKRSIRKIMLIFNVRDDMGLLAMLHFRDWPKTWVGSNKALLPCVCVILINLVA